jgi:hypothetical protein
MSGVSDRIEAHVWRIAFAGSIMSRVLATLLEQ